MFFSLREYRPHVNTSLSSFLLPCHFAPTMSRSQRALVIIQPQAIILGPISALSRPLMSFEVGQCYSSSSWQKWVHHVVATGHLVTEYLPGYMCHAEISRIILLKSPQVPILSPTGGNLRVLFTARISTACKRVFELFSSSVSFASQQQLFGFATSAT